MRALLAIDQAAVSGWAIATIDGVQAKGMVIGEASKMLERARVVKAAVAAAGDASELLVLFEDHGDFYFGRGNSSVPALLGLGASRGEWQERLRIEGVTHSHWYKVTPKVWRGAVLGLSGSCSGDRAKAEAVRWTRAFVPTMTGDENMHNAAEAACICAWGCRNLPAMIAAKRESERMARQAQKQRSV